jgi:DNA-binding CsgD family transcriptional regulator
MRIWRRRERGNFDSNEIEALRLVEPAFAAALARFQWEADPLLSPQARESVTELLQRRSALSQREAEAAALVLSGCPDKLIAKRMAVGLPTVRFHLANAFRKLRVENRTQLAARAQALVNDPLSAAN